MSQQGQSTTYVDGQGTVDATWLNDVNNTVYNNTGPKTFVDLNSNQTLNNKTLSSSTLASSVLVSSTVSVANGNLVEATSGPSSTQLGWRNRIINGACGVQQRVALTGVTGATAGVTSGIYGAVDRFIFALGSTSVTGVFNIGTSSIIINSNTTPCILVTCTTAYTPGNTTTVIPFAQRLEGSTSYDLNNKPVTISFWFQATVTGNYSVQLTDTGTQSYSTTFNYTTSAMPQFVTINVPTLPALTGNISGNGIGLQLIIGAVGGNSSTGSWVAGYTAGSAGVVNWCATPGNYVAVTYVQLEPGAVGTPYEKRPYATELTLCQRYYQVAGVSMLTYNQASNQFGYTFNYPVPMRATPVVAVAGGSYTNASALTAVNPTAVYVSMRATTTALGPCNFADWFLTLNADL